MAENDIIALKELAGESYQEIALTASDLKLGTTSGLPIKTGNGGVLEASSFGTSAGTFCEGNDARLSDARTPSSTLAHASSHAATGSDPLLPSDIGAQSIFVTEALGTITANVTLTAARAKIYTVNTTTAGLRILLPTTGVIAGDVVVISFTSSTGQTLTPVRGTMTGFFTDDLRPSDRVTFIAASSSGTSWYEENGVSRFGAELIFSGTVNAARLPIGTTAGTVAAGDHTHTQLHDRSHAITSASDHTAGNNKIFYSDNTGAITELALGAANTVLTSNGATSAPSFAAVSGLGGSTGSVSTAALRASGTGGSTVTTSDINIEDATISTQANVAITNQHSGQTNSALVLTPKGTGAFIVGSKPDGTSTGGNSRGLRAINISMTRSAATQVASGNDSIAIGSNVTASNTDSTAVGNLATASGSAASAYGRNASAAGVYATAIGYNTSASAAQSISIGKATTANASQAIAIGQDCIASGLNSIAIGEFPTVSAAYACGINASASLRSQFAARPFSSIYWGGTTTNNTATILSLDGTATNRFTIAANTALAVDILLVARRSDVSDKWLVARRFLGIRRDGSNNTSIIGAIQTIGTDQNTGSPTWTFSLTADDTNEALQLEVTGAAGETVQWAATATYRVV